MVINRILRNDCSATVVGGLLVAAFAPLLIRPSLYRGPLYGDDYLLVRDSLASFNGRSAFDDFLLVGSGKLRPISTPLVLASSRLFRWDSVPYQVVALLLLALLGVATFLFCFSATRSPLTSTICSLMVPLSQFNWYVHTSCYASMELLPIVLVLGAVRETKAGGLTDPSHSLRYSNIWILLFAATLLHERYLAVVAAFWVVCVWIGRRDPVFRRLSLGLLLIPALHFVVKGLIFRINPLAGGGESTGSGLLLRQSLVHLKDGVLGIFGGVSGAGFYYTRSTFGELVSRTMSPLLTIVYLGLTIGLCTTGWWVLKKRNSQDLLSVVLQPVLLIITGISLILPAATVAERLEGRWLYPAQLFVILGCVLLIHKTMSLGDRSYLRYGSWLVVFFGMVFGVGYKSGYQDYVSMRTQVERGYHHVTQLAPNSEPWILVVVQSDSLMPFEWQFGYGGIFDRLTNRPYQTIFSSTPSCPSLRRPLKCVILTLQGTLTNVSSIVSSTPSRLTLNGLSATQIRQHT